MKGDDDTSREVWSAAWRRDETPWVHPKGDRFFTGLLSSLAELGIQKGASVLIPLVGDSRIAKRLYRRGYSVAGVEYVPKALTKLRAQFSGVRFRRRTEERGNVFCAPRITLYEWNFLEFQAKDEFALVYDRAAMVAIAPRNRRRYAAIIRKALKPGALLVLITIEYVMAKGRDANKLGPPYGISAAHVRRFYPRYKVISRTVASDADPGARFTEAGVRSIKYTAWCLRKPQSSRRRPSKKRRKSK